MASALCACVLWHTSTACAYVLKTTKTGQRVRWSSPVITLSVDEKLVAHYGRTEVLTALTIATEAWRGLPHVPDVRLSDQPAPGYQSDARTNGVYLMMPWPYAREQLAVTVSTYDLDGNMIGADILVNGESDYTLLRDGEDVPENAPHDLAAVLTHEIGHVLGLDESPDDEMATMWPYIRGGDVHQRTLTEDDTRGIVAAYKDVILDTDAPYGWLHLTALTTRLNNALVASDARTQLPLWCVAIMLMARQLVRRRAIRGGPLLLAHTALRRTWRTARAWVSERTRTERRAGDSRG